MIVFVVDGFVNDALIKEYKIGLSILLYTPRVRTPNRYLESLLYWKIIGEITQNANIRKVQNKHHYISEKFVNKNTPPDRKYCILILFKASVMKSFHQPLEGLWCTNEFRVFGCLMSLNSLSFFSWLCGLIKTNQWKIGGWFTSGFQ